MKLEREDGGGKRQEREREKSLDRSKDFILDTMPSIVRLTDLRNWTWWSMWDFFNEASTFTYYKENNVD